MPFDNGAFDLVFCLNGLQFLPDPTAGLVEMRGVMKPGARLLVTVLSAVDRCEGHFLVLRGLERRGIDPTPMLKAFALENAKHLWLMPDFTGASIRALPAPSPTLGTKFCQSADRTYPTPCRSNEVAPFRKRTCLLRAFASPG